MDETGAYYSSQSEREPQILYAEFSWQKTNNNRNNKANSSLALSVPENILVVYDLCTKWREKEKKEETKK